MWLDFLISTDIITEKLYCLSSFQENDTEDQIICVWVCVCVCVWVCLWVCMWVYECVSVYVLAAQLCLTLCNPSTVASQGSLSMEFFRQEYWSGLVTKISIK